MREGVSLYFHIPFCTQKCAYCHFYVLPDKDIFHQQLMEGFHLEWDRVLPLLQGRTIETIYFGGGTPALIGPKAIQTILDRIQRASISVNADVEITLEANPENVSEELIRGYADVGINRISMGIQTLDNEILPQLKRLHTAERSIQAIEMTVKAGITNISVDLMYDLPGQTLKSWQATLNQIGPLPITHLSLYNLTIEPHTAFFKHRESIQKRLPDEETSLAMYEMALDVLQGAGFDQYEISAFCREGLYSRHNVGYWTARPFWGFGPSAFSYWEGKRFRNIAHLRRYVALLQEGTTPVDFEEVLDVGAARRELLTIQLRLLQGVDVETFEKHYGALGVETDREIKKLMESGYLKRDENRLKLTKQGMLFYDTVAVELI